MTSLAKTSSPELENLLGTEEFYRDPFPVYHRLREEAPVYWCEKWNRWLVTRHDDVQAIMRDPRTYSNTGRFALMLERLDGSLRLQLEALRQHFRGQGIVNADPPLHTRLRKLINKGFTPAIVERMRPRVGELVDSLLEPIGQGEPFDIIGALAFPLPTIVISEMLGAPPEDQEQFKEWAEGFTAFSQAGSVCEESALRAERCVREMTAYFGDLIKARRKDPKDDLLSALAAASEDGESLSDAELYDTCVTMLIAGHETTTSLIGNGVLQLLLHPDQHRDLQGSPELMKTGIEEMLRFNSPVLAMHRRVTCDVELRGVGIPEGDLLYMVLGAANRDPAVFKDPDKFDIRRPYAENKHVAFGYGIHFCLGAPLSRMETAAAVQALNDRFPDLRLHGEPQWKANTMVRFLEHLPVIS